MKQILFVDDEPFILEALKRTLNTMHREWDMRFANSGAEALKLMADRPADVVISDMRMPQMNGAQLLNEVMRLHPKTVRLILSGYSDQEMIMQCIGGTHQYLSKPCSQETLRNVVGRALGMDAWLNNDDLKAVVSRLGKLPSMPMLYFKILRQLDSPKATVENVGGIIAQDPGMTAKMLQLVNSAFFGLRRRLTEPTEVVVQLGLETIKALVLGIHVFGELEMPEAGEITAQGLWHHSLATATLARRIAGIEWLENQVAEDAFTAGLLHDVGRLVLLANLPKEYAEALRCSRAENIPLLEAERAVFGATHAEVGGYLLGLWGLPISLVETAVFHHCPGKSPNQTFGPLSIVHVANVLTQEIQACEGGVKPPPLDQDYLAAIGMWERVPIWRSSPGGQKTENPIHEKNSLC